jgi:hypothetical protein
VSRRRKTPALTRRRGIFLETTQAYDGATITAPPPGSNRDDLSDWPRRLVAATRRQDAQVLRQYGPLVPPGEATAQLLRACKARWPLANFDELNVAIDAIDDQRLFRAVEGVVGPVKVIGRRYQQQIGKDGERAVWRWFLGIAEIEVDGLMLHRDAVGWCRIKGWLQ